MSTDLTRALPLACAPEAIPPKDRVTHFAAARNLLLERAAGRSDLPDGYQFRFAADAFDDLVRFVGAERQCCPFLAFELIVAPAGGPLILKITGPEGTRSVLRADLDLAPGLQDAG